MPAGAACLVPDCGDDAEPGALVPLCAHHLALAADSTPREDVLPHPCLACGARVGLRLVHGIVCATCEWVHGEVPDREVAAPRVDVVYYLRFDDRVKIGTTANLRQRLGAIWHDELLAIERGDRELEHRRHVELSAARIGRTEWFALDDAVRAHVDVVAGGRDPWVLHARWRSEALATLG